MQNQNLYWSLFHGDLDALNENTWQVGSMVHQTGIVEGSRMSRPDQ